MIESVKIATNRCAPEGSSAINLYSTGLEGGSGLTLGQLAIAVSMRTAAAYEAQSVIKMNAMTEGSTKLSKASAYLKAIADGMDSADWAEAKAYLRDVLGVAEGLPESVDSYNDRMKAISALKAKVDALTQSQQEDMIDMQTLVNRRDVAFAASSNIVRALGTSASGNAENFQ